MGTNYYVKVPPSCGGKCPDHCHVSEIHLGKSSAGWTFTFRAYPEARVLEGMPFPVTNFEAWRRLLDLGEVVDEYGVQTDPETLMARIESKRGGQNTLYPRDFLDSAGNRFVSGEFS